MEKTSEGPHGQENIIKIPPHRREFLKKQEHIRKWGKTAPVDEGGRIVLGKNDWEPRGHKPTCNNSWWGTLN